MSEVTATGPKYLRWSDPFLDEKFDSPVEPVTHTIWPIVMGLGEHDMPCPVCFSAPAVVVHLQHFTPCRSCQNIGWQIVRPRWRWLAPIVRMLTRAQGAVR